MIYPEKIKAKKSDKIIKILICVSACIAILLWVINKLTTPRIHWAALANAGIIYVWITVIYSIHKNVNIAGHVLLQTIAISVLTMYIDYVLSIKSGWSINIAIPIIIIIANITMTILTIVSYKKYIKYAIYQLIIVMISMLPAILMAEHLIENNILNTCAIGVSVVNFVLCLIWCSKDMKDAIVRKFHW